MRPPRVLVSWKPDPRYMPPFVLSPHQTTVGPRVFPDQPQACYAGWTPAGGYDLFDAVRRQGLDTRFDLVVVMADATRVNMPFNVAAFGAPTVLFVGDTDHTAQPLQCLTEYARSTGFDFVVVSYNRQHLHWFVAAGCANVAWLPGLVVQPQAERCLDARREEVVFVGQFGQHHVRRRRMLEHMLRNAIPLNASQRPLNEALDLYAQARVAFNCSLNGGLNMRVLEILGAGGCLLTDRLAQEAGLDLLLNEDEDYLAYGSAGELTDKCRRMLREPATAMKIARTGAATFTRTLTPAHRIDDLVRWSQGGELPDTFRAPHRPVTRNADLPALHDRIGVYERLQELHRTVERPRVLFDDDVPAVYRDDAGDLVRLDIGRIALPDTAFSAPSPRYPANDRLAAAPQACDVAIVPAGKQPPPWLKAAAVLRTRAASARALATAVNG